MSRLSTVFTQLGHEGHSNIKDFVVLIDIVQPLDCFECSYLIDIALLFSTDAWSFIDLLAGIVVHTFIPNHRRSWNQEAESTERSGAAVSISQGFPCSRGHGCGIIATIFLEKC